MSVANSLLCLTLAVVGQQLLGAVTAKDNRCPGGYLENTQVDIGRYWFLCRGGVMVPKGCLTDDRRRVEVSQTFNTDTHVMRCVLDAQGYLTMRYEGCVQDGKPRSVNDEWQSGKAWYGCVQHSHDVHVSIVGCVDEDNRRVDLNGKVAKGDFVFQCQKSSKGDPVLAVAGCEMDGRRYDIGDTFDHERLWFMCTNSGPKCTGCIEDKQRLKDGDRVFLDDIIVTCRIDGNSAQLEPTGCIQTDNAGNHIERRIGCFWVEGQSKDNEYVMTCKYDKPSNTAVKVRYRKL